MKKIVILLLISLLFQSCFSYTRAINFKAGAVAVNQEVKIYKNNGTDFKGKVLSANKDQISIISNTTKQVVKIPVQDIIHMQGKALSGSKTIGIPLASVLGGILGFLLIWAASGDSL